ncbi:hypothetical protein FDP41_013105 [Naegleria fowleri]|uniref:EGF domain-specific O-linked N-acetylglucosamine transferase n=1 Tax=Naegleria fowleri TaxID=5763 RepID=A0A6A5C1H4_NAEFO|nr:uncharacterized protein FDP41_013105 [Naegleria fowleri]KAF0980622.1 hypothetical protein FDP41_013105 [Naegleria fowleri]
MIRFGWLSKAIRTPPFFIAGLIVATIMTFSVIILSLKRSNSFYNDPELSKIFIIDPPKIASSSLSCPLDNQETFPEKFFSTIWSTLPQTKYDGRGKKVFSTVSPKFVRVIKELQLSEKEQEYYHELIPYKLSQNSEEEICKEPQNRLDELRFKYLRDLTNKCRESDQRRFRTGTYCARADQKAWILELDCAWVDESSFHTDVSWATFNDEGIIIQSQLENGWKPTIKKSFRVRHFDKIANPGYSVFLNAIGHMPVEILPRLVRMYNELPKDVPLIWPKNPVSVNYYLMMKELGVIDGNRTLVTTELDTVIRANKLYLYHADDENFPHMNILEYLNLNKKITEGMARLFPHALKRSTSNHKIITLIDRKAYDRNVKNHGKILQRLKKTFPQHHVREFVIHPFEPSLYLQQVAKVFYESDIIISPHGASLSNIIFSRPGTGIIELGWGKLPQDYMCFSRNMKLKYTLVCGEGSHTSDLIIPENDVIQAVKTILADLESSSTHSYHHSE